MIGQHTYPEIGAIGMLSPYFPRGLCSSRREHVKMSVDSLGDNLAVVTYAIGAGKERKRRVDQIVEIDQPPIPVQRSMTTPIGRRVTARNVSSVVEACGCQGNLFKGMPTENKIASCGRSGNRAAIVNERIDNRLACDRAQIAHVAVGIKKEVIQSAARHRTHAGNLVLIVDTCALTIRSAQGTNI